MKLVCGLGNPGREYVRSRHNLGYLVIDYLCRKFKLKLRAGKGNFRYARVGSLPDAHNEEVIFAKATLFMNVSGVAVSELVQHFQADCENLLLVCDDVNLPFGKIRLRKKGSAGGHKGLESVIYHLETEEFPRLRIGVGDAIDGEMLKEYVLQEFNEEEKEHLPEVIERASQAVLVYLCEPIEEAMSKVNAINTV